MPAGSLARLAAIAKTYGRRGAEVVARNHAAVDATLEGLHQIEVPGRLTLAGRR
jgi:pyruvate-ferredoxin/flavodoxin oxidoreductase